MPTEPARVGLAAAAFLCLAGVPAAAQQDDWTLRKCTLYGAAWDRILHSHDMTGVGEGFIAAQQRFVDEGCPETTRICTVTPQEVALADLMTILSMNEGMASTFAPFGCPD